jgi:hypothetical protein
MRDMATFENYMSSLTISHVQNAKIRVFGEMERWDKTYDTNFGRNSMVGFAVRDSSLT